MGFRFVLALLILHVPGIAFGIEISGIRFEETAQVSGTTLKLKGAGLRKRAFFKVYAIGLYVAAPGSDIISQTGPKRIDIHMLRDVDAETFTRALVDGMAPNHGEAEMKALEPRIAQLSAIMAGLKEAKEGMAIALDWQPGAGTIVTVDAKPGGKPIEGEDFYRALLRIWVGEQPVQDDLKKALLGGS